MQLVFDLYRFKDLIFLPQANIIQADTNGLLTHFVQKATRATLAGQQVNLSAEVDKLLEIIHLLTPEALESKFRAPKSKTVTPLDKLLTATETRATVEGYVHRQLDVLLTELTRLRLPLTLGMERRSLAKDLQIHYAEAELIPYLFFRRTPDSVEYRLRLGTETEQWDIQNHNVQSITNTSPAWIVIDHVLFRVTGINGNMVRPFQKKDLVVVPADKTKVFFQTFIAKNARRTRIEAEGFDIKVNNILRATHLEPVEHLFSGGWLLRAQFAYDGAMFSPGETRDRITTVHFDSDIEIRQVCRDTDAENTQLVALKALQLAEEGRMFRLEQSDNNLTDWIDWLSARQKMLEKQGFILDLPQMEGKTIALLSGQISIEHQLRGDWFDIHGYIEVGPHRFPFKALIGHLRRRDPFFPLPDGTFFLIPEAWFTRYSELAEAVMIHGDDLRLAKTLFTLLQTDEVLAETVETDSLFFAVDPEQIDYTPGADLKAELRPYQLHGVRWLIGHFQHGFGACLADDMGLGKTLQTIAALLYAKQQRRSDQVISAPDGQLDLFQTYQQTMSPLQALLILPASLIFNWKRELERFAPSLFVYIHTGPDRIKKDIRAIKTHDVVLTTYHTARQDLALLSQTEWHCIVLDESQQIKNRDSEVSKVVRSLRGKHKISLSGTPIENSLADLWTQMEFINPATLGSFGQFKEQFLLPISRHDTAARDRLFGRIRPFFLRRTKEEVAPELPPKTEQVFYTEMTTAQRKAYDTVKSAVRNEVLALFDTPGNQLQVLQALTRLRQLANHPALVKPGSTDGSGKFDDVLAQWDTVQRAGHKVLFFSSFEKHLRLFRTIFEERGHPFAWLTGDTPAADRAKAVERFQQDPSVQAFFMTVKAGGVGLNLTAADYVFLLDPWWNPAPEDQAIARAHRIGQHRPVTAIRFIATGTIEEKIRLLQEEKRSLGQAFFAPDESMPQMTREDIMEILG
jgi:superfamily II DNA or RNA helicase